MSGLVLDDRLIDKSKIQTKTVTVERFSCINMGVRIWFQILTTEGEMYQRWSMLMNPTDEVMLLVKEGDKLEIECLKDQVEDAVYQTYQPFERNLILQAKFV